MSDDSMRVCLILRADLYRPWPILRAIREVEMLRSQGKDVTVVSWIKDEGSSLPPLERREGIEIRRVFLVPPRSAPSRFMAFLKVNKLMAKQALDSRPDALLVHDLEVLRAGVIAKNATGAPLLYHAHEDWPAMVSERSKLEARIFSFLERMYCRKVDNVYVPSEGIGRKYRDWGLDVTVQYASKSLANLPKIADGTRKETRARLGLDEGDKIIGLAGSLGRSEALRNIFLAMKELPPIVKLLVFGGVEEKVKSAGLMADAEGVSDRVRFTGLLAPIPYMEHVALLDVCLALFIGKTLNVQEVVPIKLFDYLAMGVPVIVSDFPAMRKIIGECDCGLAADSEDPRSIAGALRKIFQDDGLRTRLSQNARRAFEAKYCWEGQQESLKASSRVFR